MCEVLLIEHGASPCGWVKRSLTESGCKVTRVLRLKQAAFAMHQSAFDLVILVHDDATRCALAIQDLKQASSLPLLTILPDSIIAQMHQTASGVECYVSDTIPRDRLWLEAQSVLCT